MEIEENVYCRLCAELKPSSKCLNLQDDSERSQENVLKLTNLSLNFLDISDKDLPLTVCIVCLSALNNTVNFINCIEKAQEVLKKLFVDQKIKCESNWICDDYASDSELGKIEGCDLDEKIGVELKTEPEDIGTEVKKSKVRKKRKLKDDNIPLSELKNTWKHYSWLCAVCEMQFPTVKELISHAVEGHNNCTVFKCIDCNRRKLKHDTFITHVMKHRKYLRHSCHVCFKYCGTDKALTIHVQQHTMFDHVCPGCNTSFPTNAELANHKEKYYTDKRAVRILKSGTVTEADLICKICKKKFKTFAGVQTHLKLHLERKREHVCDQCGKSFYNKQTLAEHLKVHYNIRPHQCKICKYAFRTLSQLRSHIGTHEGTKPFSCEKCGKSFRLQKCLNSHMIVHTDSLPHVCPYCERGFKFKTLLNQHLRQHTGVKPYSCDICLRPFTNWPNYNKHMKRRHGMNMAKKKHTADGVFPINPVTGEVQLPLEANTEEWKRSILEKPRKKLDKTAEVKPETAM